MKAAASHGDLQPFVYWLMLFTAARTSNLQFRDTEKENHFPCRFHRNKGVKDHTPTVILSSLSPPFSLLGLLKEEFPPWARWLFWLSDWWLHEETRSIIHWQNLLDRLCLHRPFPCSPSLTSAMTLSSSLGRRRSLHFHLKGGEREEKVEKEKTCCLKSQILGGVSRASLYRPLEKIKGHHSLLLNITHPLIFLDGRIRVQLWS